jgi:hypothetical protein
MKKLLKYFLSTFITVFWVIWVLWASWSNIVSISDVVKSWDIIHEGWFNDVRVLLSWPKMDGKVCTFNAGKISCVNDLWSSSWWWTSTWEISNFFSNQQTFQVWENSQKNIWNFAICTLTRTSTTEAAKHDNGWQYRWSCWLTKTAGWWILKSEWKWRCEATCFWWSL